MPLPLPSNVHISLFLLTLLVPLLMPTRAKAQKEPITIRIIDGRTGKPISTATIVLEQADPPYLTIGKQMQVGTDGSAKFALDGIPRITPGVSGVMICGKNLNDIESFSTKEILTRGIAAPNLCGKRSNVASPGELILFYRLPTWWEKQKHK